MSFLHFALYDLLCVCLDVFNVSCKACWKAWLPKCAIQIKPALPNSNCPQPCLHCVQRTRKWNKPSTVAQSIHAVGCLQTAIAKAYSHFPFKHTACVLIKHIGPWNSLLLWFEYSPQQHHGLTDCPTFANASEKNKCARSSKIVRGPLPLLSVGEIPVYTETRLIIITSS